MYTYYFRLRPPGIGCQPKKGLVKIDFNEVIKNNRKYWGSATYDRKLSSDELFNYDLDYIKD